jgi:hypothetical protein
MQHVASSLCHSLLLAQSQSIQPAINYMFVMEVTAPSYLPGEGLGEAWAMLVAREGSLSLRSLLMAPIQSAPPALLVVLLVVLLVFQAHPLLA